MTDEPETGKTETTDDLPRFDKDWDYQDPAATEAKFREYLTAAEASGNTDYHAQLLTQIARTRGLQRDFEGARAILDEVEPMLTDDTQVARARYLLERGRAINSGGDPPASVPLFLEAWQVSRAAGADLYAVDAAHMLGIVESEDEALKWNLRAIEAAEDSDDRRARGWLGNLYQNMGYNFLQAKEHEKALDIFSKLKAWADESDSAYHKPVSRWFIGRTYRDMGRLGEALAIQEELAKAAHPTGYTYEELGECLHALGREEEARVNFAKAYELLSNDKWFVATEPDRLARMKDLGRVETP